MITPGQIQSNRDTLRRHGLQALHNARKAAESQLDKMLNEKLSDGKMTVQARNIFSVFFPHHNKMETLMWTDFQDVLNQMYVENYVVRIEEAIFGTAFVFETYEKIASDKRRNIAACLWAAGCIILSGFFAWMVC